MFFTEKRIMMMILVAIGGIGCVFANRFESNKSPATPQQDPPGWVPSNPTPPKVDPPKADPVPPPQSPQIRPQQPRPNCPNCPPVNPG